MRNRDRKAPRIESGIPLPTPKKPRKVPTERPASVIRETVEKMRPGDSIRVAAFEEAGYANWIKRLGFGRVTKRDGRIKMSARPGHFAAVRIWMVAKEVSPTPPSHTLVFDNP